jgi:hypothetical protein
VKLSKFNPERIESGQATKRGRTFQIPYYHNLLFSITIITITIFSVIIITNKTNKKYDFPTCLCGDTLDCSAKVTSWTIKLLILVL